MFSSLEHFNNFSELQQEVKRHPVVQPVHLRDRHQHDLLKELEVSLQHGSSSFRSWEDWYGLTNTFTEVNHSYTKHLSGLC